MASFLIPQLKYEIFWVSYDSPTPFVRLSNGRCYIIIVGVSHGVFFIDFLKTNVRQYLSSYTYRNHTKHNYVHVSMSLHWCNKIHFSSSCLSPCVCLSSSATRCILHTKLYQRVPHTNNYSTSKMTAMTAILICFRNWYGLLIRNQN